MNDIYEQKAKKYKYKYLKLKREIEGGIKHSERYKVCKKDCKKEYNFNDSILNLNYMFNKSEELKTCIDECKKDEIIVENQRLEKERIENLPKEEQQRLKEKENAAKESARIQQEAAQKKHDDEFRRNMKRAMEQNKLDNERNEQLQKSNASLYQNIRANAAREKTKSDIQEFRKYQ
jgi:hypothetical protein